METRESFGMIKSKTVHLEAIVLLREFLTKPISVKVWCVFCKAYLFFPPNATFSLSRQTWFWSEDNWR